VKRLAIALLGTLLSAATLLAQTPVPCPTDAGGKYRCAECSSTTSCTWWSWNYYNPSIETVPYEQYRQSEGRHAWKAAGPARTGSASIAIIYPDDFPSETDANDAVQALQTNTWNTKIRIPAVAGKTYSARVYAQIEATDQNPYGPASAYMTMLFKDANGFLVGGLLTSNSLQTATTTWTALTVPATVAPTNTDRVELNLRLKGNSAAYFDDLSIWDTAAPTVNLMDVQPTH
jgi:hypothetical protein